MTLDDNTEIKKTCDQWLASQQRCDAEPYCEVIDFERGAWSYLCRWHYHVNRLYCFIHRIKHRGYVILGDEDE